MNNNTIAAICTPYGVGGVGIVRISGDKAKEIASRVFNPIGKRNINNVKGFSAIYGHVFDKDGIFDEAIATVFNAPKSYTGENCVEISCHGGTYIMERVLNAVLDAGGTMADAGEFTKRAFLNGKLSLEQAESVIDLINAKSKLSAAAALSVKDGVLNKKINEIAEKTKGLTAHLNVWTDYPDEDIPEVTDEELNSGIDEIIQMMNDLLKSYNQGRVIKDGVSTVIVGKPNVGKSTLMNALSGQQISIVTHVAGTTRDVVEETIKLGDIVLKIADTAGIHNTDDIVESIGVEAAKKKIDASALIIAVFDGNSEIDEDDRNIVNIAKNHTSLAVINKADKQILIDKNYIYDNFDYVVEISAKELAGLDILSEKIKEIYKINNFDSSAPMLYTLRQKECITKALQAALEAKDALDMGMTFDAVNVCIEDVLTNLLELSGKTASEEVVNSVFSKFCVGK